MKHGDEIAGDIHGPFQWIYANTAARTGAGGFVTADVTQRKCCVQNDNNTAWMLTSTAPTWIQISGPGSTKAYGFIITGALTTASTLADVTIPYGGTLSNIIADVGTAVATADMTINVTYGTNPASKATLFATTNPKIVNGATTSTDGVLTTTSVAARGHFTITFTGTFTAASDLTIWFIMT